MLPSICVPQPMIETVGASMQVQSWGTWDSYARGPFVGLADSLLIYTRSPSLFLLMLFASPSARSALGSEGPPYFAELQPLFPSQVFPPLFTSNLILVPVSGRFYLYVKHFYCITKYHNCLKKSTHVFEPGVELAINVFYFLWNTILAKKIV